MEVIQSLDWAVLHWIQKHLACDILDSVMPIVTSLSFIWVLAAAVMLFIRSYRRCGVNILLAIALGLLVVNLIIKPLVARERPCWLDESFALLVSVPEDHSFPSGHSFFSFAAATAIFLRDKRFGVPALVLAAFIAFSRLYLYVHFPTDVLCGSAIGIGLAVLARCILKAVVGRSASLDRLLPEDKQ